MCPSTIGHKSANAQMTSGPRKQKVMTKSPSVFWRRSDALMISFKLCPQPIVSLVQGLTWEMWQTKRPLFRQQLIFSHIGKPLSKQSSVAEQEEEKKRWRYLNRTGLCKTIVRENGLCKEVRMVCAKRSEWFVQRVMSCCTSGDS